MRVKFLSICVLVLFFVFLFFLNLNKYFHKNFEVTFLNVGQGDATLIKTPDNSKILIDGGPDKTVLTRVGETLNFYDHEIDIVIATHEDSDHITGLKYILENYKVKLLIVSWFEKTTIDGQELLEIAKNRNVRILNIDQTKDIKIDDGVNLEILFPDTNMDGGDTNSHSIVTKINFNKINFLLTGDLPQSGENYLILKYKDNLKSQILKLGHHGSDTSSSPIFLKTVSPEVAIVSAGKNNSFGHPHKSVLDLCEKFGIKVLRTDELGSIGFESDGERVWRR